MVESSVEKSDWLKFEMMDVMMVANLVAMMEKT
jgi:hypothetical protein